MKKPKRLRFVPASHKKSDYELAAEGLRMIADAFASVAAPLGRAVVHMGRVVQVLADAGNALLSDPEFQQEMKMKQLYYDSWKQNELADTLAAAKIRLT